MNNPTKDDSAPLPNRMGLEVAVVFALQLAVVSGLVHLDGVIELGGLMNALVGAVFIFLPVLVLDRRGKPYRRYGLTFGRPLGDLLWALALASVLFVPLFFLAPWFWSKFWNIGAWSLTLPEGYPETALTHLVVVALPEEFFYRGYLMGRLDDIFKGRIRVLGAQLGWGFVFQAALFALGHFLIDFNATRLAVFFPALAFGWLRAKRGSIGASVVLHMASNVFMDFLTEGFGFGG